MYECSIQKEPGCFFKDLNGSVHEFFVADSSHHQTENIHRALLGISKTMLSEPYSAHTSGMFCASHGEM